MQVGELGLEEWRSAWHGGEGREDMCQREGTQEQSLHSRDPMRELSGPVMQDRKRGMMGNSFGALTEAGSCLLGCPKTYGCCLWSLPPDLEQAGSHAVPAGSWRKESEGRGSFSFASLPHGPILLISKYIFESEQKGFRLVLYSYSHVLAQTFPLATESRPSPTFCQVRLSLQGLFQVRWPRRTFPSREPDWPPSLARASCSAFAPSCCVQFPCVSSVPGQRAGLLSADSS